LTTSQEKGPSKKSRQEPGKRNGVKRGQYARWGSLRPGEWLGRDDRELGDWEANKKKGVW